MLSGRGTGSVREERVLLWWVRESGVAGASVSARPARVPCGCVSVSVGSARVRVCVYRLLCYVRVERGLMDPPCASF